MCSQCSRSCDSPALTVTPDSSLNLDRLPEESKRLCTDDLFSSRPALQVSCEQIVESAHHSDASVETDSAHFLQQSRLDRSVLVCVSNGLNDLLFLGMEPVFIPGHQIPMLCHGHLRLILKYEALVSLRMRRSGQSTFPK